MLLLSMQDFLKYFCIVVLLHLQKKIWIFFSIAALPTEFIDEMKNRTSEMRSGQSTMQGHLSQRNESYPISSHDICYSLV